eukprot:TRINITY_DN9277_c0_g1_i1.p1 TRINITY_DN9277_c0_g1~~TRINITY_DN9277_c0_g1_i1.p1  ORF type:complete len:192 (+),score=45.66 TRINITY_DN9277_c0_g1_i1:69-644(+)
MGLRVLINDFLQDKPFISAALTSSLLAVASDLFTQLLALQRRHVDGRQTLAFAAWGAGFLGLWYCLVYRAYDRLFGGFPFGVRVAVMCAVDNAVHMPLVSIPLFYLFMGWARGSPLHQNTRALRKEWWQTVWMGWLIWVPFQTLNFSLVPLHLRLPAMMVVSFFWNALLSYLVAPEEQPKSVLPDEENTDI